MRSLRIGTWNLAYATGTARNARRLQRLFEADADLWVLTETHDDLDLSASHTAVPSEPRPGRRAGSRWVTLWSRLPLIQRLPVRDPCRTVAALLDADGDTLLLYGTVLPWPTDPGSAPAAPARSWAEHHRVLPEQAEEWASLQQRYPDATLMVAGDLNMNLGGPHYYGTARGRRMLREAMANLGLFCATETERVPAGALTWPPIDHVLLPTAWEPRAAVVAAWEGRAEDGVRLSDHSGLVVEVRDWREPDLLKEGA